MKALTREFEMSSEVEFADAELTEDVEPVSEGLRGTWSCEDLRRLLLSLLVYEQLLGILITHRLW